AIFLARGVIRLRHLIRGKQMVKCSKAEVRRLKTALRRSPPCSPNARPAAPCQTKPAPSLLARNYPYCVACDLANGRWENENENGGWRVRYSAPEFVHLGPHSTARRDKPGREAAHTQHNAYS